MITNTFRCDLCGATFNEELQKYETQDFIHIKKDFGYGTNLDGKIVEMDICPKCFYDKILSMVPENWRDEIITEIPF